MLTVVMMAPMMLGIIGSQTAHAQQGKAAAGGNVLTVIIIDFANKSGIGGEALGRFATDAVAVEMASAGRFEVLKRDEVVRTANELGYRMPYDQAQLTKIASTLGATGVVTGEVSFVHSEGKKGMDKTVSAGLKVRVLDTSSGELLNGAAQSGSSLAKPGLSDTDTLAQDAIGKAAVLAVKQILTFTLPEGIILNTVGKEGAVQVLINRGSRDGIKEGMEMLVIRDKVKVGKIRVTNVFPTDSEAVPTANILGLKPTDFVRAVFPMPEFDKNGVVVRPRSGSTGSFASVGKVLLIILAGAVIATAIKGGGSVTGVTAEADLVNGTPAVQLHWRDNLFGGQTLEYHIWRTPGVPYNFTGNPVAAVALARQYTDQPAPFSFWDGVRSFLQAPNATNSGGGNTGGGGSQNATSVTPAALSVPGFTAGASVIYQVSAVVRRTSTSQNNTGGGGGTGGGTGTTVTEDIETDPVNSGVSTPINQLLLRLPVVNAQSQNLKSMNFTWSSRLGADVYQVEISTDQSFTNKALIAQLPLVLSTAPNSDLVDQTLSNPIDLTTNATLKKDAGFAAFVNKVPGAVRPTIYWRVGGRNSADRPGPVHNLTRNPKDEDKAFRFIYSQVRSFQPADLPPGPP